MGAGNAGSGGGRQDGNQMNSTVFNKVGVGRINEKGQSLEKDAFRNRGAEKIKKGIKTPSLIVNAAGAILSKPLQAGSKITRDFYTDKVLGSKNFKGQTKEDFLSKSEAEQEKQYSDYIGNRNSGRTDAYGNTINNQGGDGGNNTPTVIKKNIGGNTIQTTAPTEAEVSQSEAANADAAALKVKKRGRSASIMTGPKGVTRTSTDYSLGKKSLLGQV